MTPTPPKLIEAMDAMIVAYQQAMLTTTIEGGSPGEAQASGQRAALTAAHAASFVLVERGLVEVVASYLESGGGSGIDLAARLRAGLRVGEGA